MGFLFLLQIFKPLIESTHLWSNFNKSRDFPNWAHSDSNETEKLSYVDQNPDWFLRELTIYGSTESNPRTTSAWFPETPQSKYRKKRKIRTGRNQRPHFLATAAEEEGKDKFWQDAGMVLAGSSSFQREIPLLPFLRPIVSHHQTLLFLHNHFMFL